MQTELVFYRNAQIPIIGNNTGSWEFHGAALSASTAPFNGNLITHNIKQATFRTDWNPMAGPSWKGIELVKCDDGPVNIEPMGAQFLRSNQTTPVPDAADVTAYMQGLIDLNLYKHLGIRTVGDGASGPLIYSAFITIVWDD